jgi:hypothetical protein
MKDLVFLALTSLVMFCSCNSCSKKENQIVTDDTLSVEEMIKADTDIMNGKNKKAFAWLETSVLLNTYLDEDSDGTFNRVTNVFQAVDYDDTDPVVYQFQHFSDGVNVQDSTKGFWIEDFPLVSSSINVPYDSAFNLVMQVNLPKPHSKNVVLRNPVGPNPCNPQWVFGNLNSQIWVDATTGEIRESNPAFPKGSTFTW